MNYYERHIGDYARDAGHLTLAEHGVYSVLMDRYYATESGIPEDQVRRITRASTKAEREAVANVLRDHFRLVDGLWINNRCEQEIARYRAKQDKARKSAEARWGKNANASETDANASPSTDAPDMRTHCEGNAPRARSSHQTPDPKQEPSPAPASKTSEGRALSDESLPPEVNPDTWRLFESHHDGQRRWSLARSKLAIGQLKALIAQGRDPNAVLEWATLRGLVDLADCARRMDADHAKTEASDKRPGESLADAAARRMESRTSQPARAIEAPGLIPLGKLAHDR